VKLLSQSLFPWTPLGAAVDAGGEHTGVEPGAHVNARLQHIAGAGGLYRVLFTATAGIPGAEPAVAARLLGWSPAVLLLIVVVIACVHVVTIVVCGGFVTAIVVVAIVSSSAAVVSPIVAPAVVIVPCVCPIITAIPVITTVIFLGGTVVSVVESAAATISVVTSAAAAGIGGTVPWPAVGSGAGVASVLGLPRVTLAGRVRFPGSVLCTG